MEKHLKSQLRIALVLLALYGSASAQTKGPTCVPGPAVQLADTYGDLESDLVDTEGLVQQSCRTHTLNASSEACSLPNSSLIIEWWGMEADGSAIGPLTTISDSFFLAARGEIAPIVSSVFGTRHYATTPFLTNSSDTSLRGTFSDPEGTKNSRSYRRIVVPWGQGYQQQDDNGGTTWAISITNLGATWLPGYRIRAFCTEELPCPSPDVVKGQCSGPGQGRCVTGESAALQSYKGQQLPTCQCEPGFADDGCAAPVEDLSKYMGQDIKLSLPPSTFRYFYVDMDTPVPDTARLLAELSQPEGSFIESDYQDGFGVQGSLTLAPKQVVYTKNNQLVEQSKDVPVLSDVSGSALYQREPFLDYTYAFLDVNVLKGNPQVWVAVYNAAPRLSEPPTLNSSTPAPSVPITLRVRWSPEANQTSTFCPQDCNNRGTCLNENSPNQSYGYECICKNADIGGPRCDGSQAMLPISTSKGFNEKGDGPNIYIPPYTTQYFVIPVEPSSSSAWKDQLLVYWDLKPNPAAHQDQPTYMFSSRYFPDTSKGLLYFDKSHPRIVKSSDQYAVDVIYYSVHYDWFIFIRNSGNVSQSYSLTIVMSSPPNNDLFRWQLGLGAAVGVCGLIALLGSCYIMTGAAFRRRDVFRRRLTNDPESGAGGSPRTREGPLAPTVAVPPVIIDTFHTFKYGEQKPLMMKSMVAAQALGPALVEGSRVAEATDAVDAAAGGGPLSGRGTSTTPHMASEVAAAAAASTGEAGTPPTSSETSLAPPIGLANPNNITMVIDGGNHRNSDNNNRFTVAAAAGISASPRESARQPAGGAMSASSSEPELSAAGGQSAAGDLYRAESSVQAAVTSEHHDKEFVEDQCSVCICEYSHGEMLRQLPCGHYFHKDCIDLWMKRNASCPICRQLLVEESVLAAELAREREQRAAERARRRAARRQRREASARERREREAAEQRLTASPAVHPQASAPASTMEMSSMQPEQQGQQQQQQSANPESGTQQLSAPWASSNAQGQQNTNSSNPYPRIFPEGSGDGQWTSTLMVSRDEFH